MCGVIDQIQQHQGLRRRRVASDPHALGLELLVARFGDIARELALESLGRGLGCGHDQQPARIGRQFGIANVDVFAQIERRRRSRRIPLAQFLGVFFAGLGFLVQPLQRRKRAQLHVAQIVGLGRRIGIFFRLDDGGRRRDTRVEIVDEPVVADAEAQQFAVGGELRSRLLLRRARDLAQPAFAQVANEDVAVAGKRRAFAGAIEHRRSIGVRHALGIDDSIVLPGEIDMMQIDDRRPLSA